MSSRQAWVRRGLIGAGVIGVVLTVYVGSFALIRWWRPDRLLGSEQGFQLYLSAYAPLRWIIAWRPRYLPPWRREVTLPAEFASGEPMTASLFIAVDGVAYRVDRGGGVDTRGLKPGDAITVRLVGTLTCDGYLRDFVSCRVESLVRR